MQQLELDVVALGVALELGGRMLDECRVDGITRVAHYELDKLLEQFSFVVYLQFQYFYAENYRALFLQNR